MTMAIGAVLMSAKPHASTVSYCMASVLHGTYTVNSSLYVGDNWLWV